MGRASETTERVRLALDLKLLAEALMAAAVAQAHGAGQTWRDLGAELGMPFQTLFRRYGSAASSVGER